MISPLHLLHYIALLCSSEYMHDTFRELHPPPLETNIGYVVALPSILYTILIDVS